MSGLIRSCRLPFASGILSGRSGERTRLACCPRRLAGDTMAREPQVQIDGGWCRRDSDTGTRDACAPRTPAPWMSASFGRSISVRIVLLLAIVLAAACAATAGGLAVLGERVHTQAGPPIGNGVVLIEDGRIVAVGSQSEIKVPEGWSVLTAAVVTPGLVDAHSTVGLAGALNQAKGDKDELDKTEAIQPGLRALDAFNARDPLVAWVRGFGVTTVHTAPAAGSLISGQTFVVKTAGRGADADALRPVAMVAASLGSPVLETERKAPTTRSKAAAMLRTEFIKAREYAEKRGRDDDKKPALSINLETLASVLRGDMPLMLTANRHHDILTALRLREEFGFKLVLDGATEATAVIDEIRAAGVPVIVHPAMKRPFGEGENVSMETAAMLRAAGVPIALQSGYEGYVPRTRVVLFEAAVAAARGLGSEAALSAITIDAARLIGVADRVGSIEKGKDADLALYDGDPFEYTTRCTNVVINGEVFPGEPRD
jgi:imidazolonepropionase-like amidohydrolase